MQAGTGSMDKDGIFPAETAEEKEAIYRFRYEIYVEEMGRYRSIADHERRLLIDAGGIALSKDRSTRAFANPDHEIASDLGDFGYGLVCNAEGELLEGLQVVEAWQEHGVVEARPGFDLDLEDFPIGTMLRILPNHACMTAAAHDGPGPPHARCRSGDRQSPAPPGAR